ncbi:MAG: small basic protein [Planctomycetes bacterium]|nr:small basic protein [Planctomycetota bacterium]
MSVHKSLALKGRLKRHRNVLTRSERIDTLRKEGRWDDERSIFNLPKVRNIMARAKAKPKAKAAEGAAAAPGAAAPGAAAPTAAPAAAGAKGTAPAAAAAKPAGKKA